VKVNIVDIVSNLKVIFAQTNPNILLAHYFQYKRIKKIEQKTHKFVKKMNMKCKSFCWNFATTNLPPPMKLQLAKQCKGRGCTNHRGANNTMSIATTWWASTTTWWTSMVVHEKINEHNENLQQHDQH
jgi:hypothetical protein